MLWARDRDADLSQAHRHAGLNRRWQRVGGGGGRTTAQKHHACQDGACLQRHEPGNPAAIGGEPQGQPSPGIPRRCNRAAHIVGVRRTRRRTRGRLALRPTRPSPCRREGSHHRQLELRRRAGGPWLRVTCRWPGSAYPAGDLCEPWRGIVGKHGPVEQSLHRPAVDPGVHPLAACRAGVEGVVSAVHGARVSRLTASPAQGSSCAGAAARPDAASPAPTRRCGPSPALPGRCSSRR